MKLLPQKKKENKMSLETKIALFVSRHKDNLNIPNFKERRFACLYKEGEQMTPLQLFPIFGEFVKQGEPNEVSRIYVSVNARDMKKVRKQLIIKLINDEEADLLNLPNIITSIAAKPENAKEKKWLLDVDIKDPNERIKFEKDLLKAMKETSYDLKYETPNGIGYIVSHHFDVRPLQEKWKEKFTLKKDSMRFIHSMSNAPNQDK